MTETIKMAELKPMQIGIISSKKDHPEYHGKVVMRNASTEHFEVMILSDPGADSCWTDPNTTLRVIESPLGFSNMALKQFASEWEGED